MISRRSAIFLVLAAGALAGPHLADPSPQAQKPTALKLPLKDGSIRFAVIGDTGRANSGQIEVGAQMAAVQREFPFNLVIMLGDNIYGTDSPADMDAKFASPYKALLDRGVEFRAAIGNHDNPNQRFYKLFNMGGERYYTFHPPKNADGKGEVAVRFYALDTNYLEKVQTDWLEKELASSVSPWKIAFFHHPLYSSGKTHGSALETRAILEPLFIKYGMSAAFSGHDHFYERILPQKGGIGYWVSGAGGSLRKGDVRVGSALTAKAFDTDYSFMIIEIAGDDMYFQAISRRGETIDSGVFHRPGAKAPEVAATPSPAPVLIVPAPVPAAVPAVSPAAPAGTPRALPSPSASPTGKASPSPAAKASRSPTGKASRSPTGKPSPSPSPTRPPA